MMRRSVVCAVLLLLTCLSAAAQREKIRLDDGWLFHLGDASDPAKDFGCGTEYFNYLTKAASLHNEGPYAPTFDDSAWQTVRVPHDWVSALPYDSAASHSHGYKTVGVAYPATSVGWYRKTFTIPASDLGRHLAIQFDGIYRAAQVWCNGIFMGEELSGYATQVYDITDYVNYGGENVLCVRADATMEEGWYYEGAGIYRDAWLLKEAPLHVAQNGTSVVPTLSDDFSTAVLTVATTIENTSMEAASCVVRTALVDGTGQVVASADEGSGVVAAKDKTTLSACLTLSAPHLWDVDDPYLYTIRTEVCTPDDGAIVDTYTTRTGIRQVLFTADEGLLLNGKQVKIKGVNMHQDHAGVGTALPDALLRWRVKQLKAIGCNAYRGSHHPLCPALLDICDEEGMLVVEENRLVGTNDYHVHLLENFILRDRNHPCIILWSLGNEEWGLENSATGTRLARSLTAIARRLDPTRPSTIANAGGSELIKGLDVVGYNYIVQNDVFTRRHDHPEWKIVGTEETTGCGTRGVYFNDASAPWHMASLNRIPTDSAGHVDYSPAAVRPTPPSYSQGIERGWTFYRDTPWAAGCCFWTGFDYRGEPNPLSYPAHDSQFGLFDYCGFPKDEAYYLLSAWSDTPVVHLLPQWALPGHEGETIDVWAYSNCEEVSLRVNGKDYGRQTMPKDGHAVWAVPYAPGKVVAHGYRCGKRVVEEVLATPDVAALIESSPDRATLLADGHDVAVVSVTITDKRGLFVPTACPLLSFRLEGEGRILGVGNGDPACLLVDNPNEKDCKAFSYPAFNGCAQVLVQTTTSPGSIRLVCSSADGTLLPSSLSLTSAAP